MQPANNNAPEGACLWQVPECPVAIAYPAELMDSIRLAVLEAFYAFPRGGAEVGGILFGTLDGAQVTVSAFRDLSCEHALGPSFVLSEHDRARIADLLTAPATDAGLHGLVPVGWYHSHTRSEIFLSEQDVEIHSRFFPESWQVALVLRPSISGTRAGFFVRDRAGNLRAEASYQVFPIFPLSGRALARAGQSAPEPASAATAATPAQAKVEPEPPENIPDFASEPLLELPPPSFLLAEPRRPRRLLPFVALASALVVSAGIYASRDRWMGFLSSTGAATIAAPATASRSEAVDLQTLDVAGQLQIRWNRDAAPVLHARSGALDIRDGSALTTLTFDPERLRTGAATYVRQTDRIELRLTLEQPDGRHITGFTTFVGNVPEPAAPPTGADNVSRRQRDELEAQLREARTQLINQTLLIQQLQHIIREMQPAKAGSAPQSPPPATPRTPQQRRQPD